MTPTVVLVLLVMPYLFCSQRLGGRTLRSGSVDKPVMGAFCAGSYEVTPPGRLRATTSSAGPPDRPKDSSTRQAYGESDPAEDVSHILTGLRSATPVRRIPLIDSSPTPRLPDRLLSHPPAVYSASSTPPLNPVTSQTAALPGDVPPRTLKASSRTHLMHAGK